MVKMVLLLKRRAGMSVEDFKDYYEKKHAVLGRKILSKAVRYEQRFIQSMSDGLGETYDCITEVWFNDEAGMQAALASAAEPGNAALRAEDAAKLFERDMIRFYVVTEERSSL